MSKWRSRNRDLWAPPKTEADAKGGKHTGASEDPGDAATRREIEDLQSSAPRPKDNRPGLLGSRVVRRRHDDRAEATLPSLLSGENDDPKENTRSSFSPHDSEDDVCFR